MFAAIALVAIAIAPKANAQTKMIGGAAMFPTKNIVEKQPIIEEQPIKNNDDIFNSIKKDINASKNADEVIKNENAKWLKEKQPEKPRKRQDENRVAYGFFRKKYAISKVYNACRG